MRHDSGAILSKSSGPCKRAALWLALLVLLSAQAVMAETISGHLSVVWGDAPPGCAGPDTPLVYLTDVTGGSIRLVPDAAVLGELGSVLLLNGYLVTVEGAWTEDLSRGNSDFTFRFTAIRQMEKSDPVSPAIAGSQPWVSLMLKFSDVATEPKTLAFFQNMYSTSSPGLDHYWQENSGTLINLPGSTAYGWFTLPHPRSYYITGAPGEEVANLTALFNDGTAVADDYVDFSPFVGINLMFNDLLDCCAWGGNRWATLDGVEKSWRVTWEPPWGYENVAVIAHETGHGFGLPHSSGEYGETYDNDWDVMSNSWLCTIPDPTYGCVGQHTIMYHKDLLAWVAADRKLTVEAGGQRTLTLERSAQPATTNLRLIRLPILGSSTNFITVEARRRVGYDLQLPGEGVIIHEVDTLRDNRAHVIDSDGNGDTGDAGAMWLPGETYTHLAGNITVTVNLATATGWIVTVRNQPPTDPSGDVNGDTLVNSADLAILQNVQAGNFDAGTYPCTLWEMGDFDASNAIDSPDCVALANYFSGN